MFIVLKKPIGKQKNKNKKKFKAEAIISFIVCPFYRTDNSLFHLLSEWTTKKWERLAHVFLKTPVVAALVIAAAVVVVGARLRRAEAGGLRAGGSNGRAGAELRAHRPLRLRHILAAVVLTFGRPAPVPATAGASASWETASGEASSREASSGEASASRESASGEASLEESALASSPWLAWSRHQEAAQERQLDALRKKMS